MNYFFLPILTYTTLSTHFLLQKNIFCTTRETLCWKINKQKMQFSYCRRGAVVNWWKLLSFPLNSWQRRMFSIHPLGVEERKKLFFFPWKYSVLYSLCVSAPRRAAHVFTRASSDHELPVCLLTLLRYFTLIREIHILQETEWNLPSSDRWTLRYAHSLTRKRLRKLRVKSPVETLKSVKLC